MNIKRIASILLILFICFIAIQFITGPHIYSVVKEAFTTNKGYSEKISDKMSKDVFESINAYHTYPFDDKDSSIKLNLYPLGAVHNFKSGYVWMKYSISVINSKGEIDAGSWNIICKFKVEKINDKWYITNKSERN